MEDYNQAMASSYLQNDDEEDDDQVLFLYKQLMDLPFNKVETIIQIERSLYEEAAEDPEDELIYIALMQVNTMLGNYDKAKALAYKIWDMGADLGRAERYLYVNNLLNLGLLDMAATMLKPCFEDFNQGMKDYFAVILKFATITANTNLLERILTNPLCVGEEAYLELYKKYKNYNYIEHFKNVQKILLNDLQGKICVYDYDITQGVFLSLDLSLYVNIDKAEIPEYEQKIKAKLQEYYSSKGLDKLSNFSWKLLPISTHIAMGLD